MKIVCFADLHLGVKHFGSIDPATGLNTRELDALNSLDELIDYAYNNNIKVIAAAGDMYLNSSPSPTLQEEFNKRIVRASKLGIYTLILDGNHDVSKMNLYVSPLKPFSTFELNNSIHTRFFKDVKITVDNETVRFIFLPTYHTKEDIEKIINEVEYDGTPIVYIGHLTIKNAFLNDWLVEDKEIYIDAEKFNKKGVKAVILGHLHKHQILRQEPIVFYTGSTQRVDFNEERQQKGFCVIDVKQNIDHSTDLEFVEVKTQTFKTIKLKIKKDELEDKTDIINVTDMLIEKINLADTIKDSIVRINIESDIEITLDEKLIFKMLEELGAKKILNINKKIEVEKAVRNSELTEHISIEDGLELYYKDKTRSKERIKLGKEIIEACTKTMKIEL